MLHQFLIFTQYVDIGRHIDGDLLRNIGGLSTLAGIPSSYVFAVSPLCLIFEGAQAP